LRQRAAAPLLLAGALVLLAGALVLAGAPLLVAGRAEPGTDVPFVVAEPAAPAPHPIASTYPATIAIIRGVVTVMMTTVGEIRLGTPGVEGRHEVVSR
jgi:hypothetical protein